VNTPAGAEAPLEMLSACHLRIERQCATLRRLVPHLAAHGATEDARTAAANVMRYFDSSALQHHADEEEDLFPALERIAAGTSARLASDDVEALIGRYERHIEWEEKELLPMAARLLSDDELARIGRAMRERRGIGAV